MKVTLFKTLYVFLCALLMSTTSNAQLITIISDADAALSSEDEIKLGELRANPAYESIDMIQIDNIFDVQDGGKLEISLPGYPNLTAFVTDVDNPSHSADPTDFFWGGRFLDTLLNEDTVMEQDFFGYFELYREGNQFRGVASPPHSDDAFEIATFPSGKTMLIKYTDNDEFSCGIAESGGEHEKVTGPCNNVIRVLVLYTQRGDDAVSNIANTAKEAVDMLNGAIWNTIKDMTQVSYVLAGVTSTGSWTEPSSDLEICVTDFANTTYIQYLRGLYMADLVVGLTDANDPKRAGIVRDIGPWYPSAFALVEADQANNDFVFAHEVGHLTGGRHQQCNMHPSSDCDDAPGHPHGMAVHKNYFLISKYYNDIQHVRTGGKTEHVFSHYNLTLHGRTFGDYNTNDVMRNMIDNACTIAAFQADTIPYFLAKISGPASAVTGNNVTMTVTPVNGYANYTYEWWTSSNGGSNWTQHSTTSSSYTSSKTVTMPNTATLLFSVKATDAIGKEHWLKKSVYNNLFPTTPYNGPSPSYKMSNNNEEEQGEQKKQVHHVDAIRIYPNPANDILNISLSTKGEPNHQYTVRICDIYGKTLYQQQFATTNYTWQLDCSQLCPGSYVVQLEGSNVKETQRFTILN